MTLDQLIEIYDTLMDENFPALDPNNDDLRRTHILFKGLVDDASVSVGWPEVQSLMEEEWFDDEAVLDLNQASTYFIPFHRLLEVYSR